MIATKGLNNNQHKFLLAMLELPTIEKAAKKAGITNVTAHKYLGEPVFQDHLQETRRQLMNQVTTRLQRSSEKAVQTLESIMEDRDAPATARVSAAKTVLDNAYKGIDIEEILIRVTELETLIHDTYGE